MPSRIARYACSASESARVGAVAHGYLQPFTPEGISNFPSFISQGNGLYVFSPDPAITIYSIWGIALALSIRSLTLAYFVMSSAFTTVSESLDNSARSAGASWWTAMTRITFPILRPALFVSFILLFISILNDYDPALFLVTPGHEIMGVTMLDAAQQGTTGPVAALAMVQVAITIVAIAVGGQLFVTKIGGRRYT
jgi:ABC-type Fe3+ transport system permease subunit